MRLPLSTGLLLVSLCAPLVGQTRFCIGGELDHLSSAEKTACQAKATQLRDAVRHRGAPADWHFVVVCDEAGWSDYASFAGREATRMVHAGYSTDRAMRLTVVRGSRLEAEDEQVAEEVLSVALRGVPGVVPALPLQLPNPQRSLHQPSLQVAEAHGSENEEVAGQ